MKGVTRNIEENQLDLFDSPETSAGADSPSSPGQASNQELANQRYIWPPGFWLVAPADDPQQAIQMKASNAPKAIQQACRYFPGYPKSALTAQPLRVAHGGYRPT